MWDAVKDKCYADKPETIDFGEVQLHTIDNVLKNWFYCLGVPLPLFNQNYCLLSPLKCALNLYVSGGTYSLIQFNVGSERQTFLRNFFTAGLFTPRVFASNLLRGSRRRNLFYKFRFYA